MDRWKKPLLFPYTYTLSSSTVGLLLHLQYYQSWEPMIFKICKESKFVLWQSHSYNLLTEKDKKSSFLKYSFLWERTVTVSVKKLSSNIVFRRNSFGKFYIVKLNCFSGRPKIRWKRCFEIFLIDHCIDDIGIKILLVIIKKILYQCHPPYTRRFSSHRVLHLKFLGIIYIFNSISICSWKQSRR